MTPCVQNLMKNLKYHSGSSISDYTKRNFVLCTVTLFKWLRHMASAELVLVPLIQIPHLLSIIVMLCHQLYFPKEGVLLPFAPIYSKMLKSGTVQTECSLGQNSTSSCLNTCL